MELRSLVANFGTAGAVRNAELAILARRAEERAIAGLTIRLAELDAPGRVTPAA